MNLTPWSAERTAKLRELWPTGISSTLIAAELSAMPGPELSSDAVVCKRSRLKLPARSAELRKSNAFAGRHRARTELRSQARAFGETRVPPAVVFGKLASPEPKTPFHNVRRAAELPLPGSHPKVWTERGFGQCAWVVGGEGAHVLSCCEPVFRGSWCAEHHRIGHQKFLPGRPATAAELARSLRRHVG